MTVYTCPTSSNNSAHWGTLDATMWKLVPEWLGGGKPYIRDFKTAWVQHNKNIIRSVATDFSLPPELLAGVCWIEVGGDPEFFDIAAYKKRAAFQRLGWEDKPKGKTSFGQVSMQLTTAAQTLGMDTNKMRDTEYLNLARCLEIDVFNIAIVGKHLRQLADHDGFTTIGLEEVRIIGARYNRGMHLSIEQIRKNTSYGDFIVNNWQMFSNMLW